MKPTPIKPDKPKLAMTFSDTDKEFIQKAIKQVEKVVWNTKNLNEIENGTRLYYNLTMALQQGGLRDK